MYRARHYDPQIRETGEAFLQHLHDSGHYKTAWDRDDLNVLYQQFRAERSRCYGRQACFSTVLFHAARYAPLLLQVRGGTRVIFIDKGGGGQQYNAENVSRDLAATARRSGADRYQVSALEDSLENLLEPHHEQVYVSLSATSHVNESPVSHYNCIVQAGSDDQPIIHISVENKSEESVTLTSVSIMKDSDRFRIKDATNLAGVSIYPGASMSVSVSTLLHSGECSTGIQFRFQRANKAPFSLLRFLEFNVSKTTIDDLLAPTSPYRYLQFRPGREDAEIIDGQKPPKVSYELEKERPLDASNVPSSVKLAVQRKAFHDQSEPLHPNDDTLRSLLDEQLSLTDYGRKFQLLLHIEELQNQNDIKRYDMVSTMIKKPHARLLYLCVPGLAEKRPSVLRGDWVYVTKIGLTDGKEYGPSYRGFVHKVELNHVGIHFHDSFFSEFVKNKQFYIRFTIGRLPFKLMHRAVKLIHTHPLASAILFPTRAPTASRPEITLTMRNRNIQNNQQQVDAVHNIVVGETSPVYIIYGPPGTGKTVTMVEAIVQTISAHPGAHVMVCAPSNSACDLLTERLCNNRVDKKDILRMHAASRNWADVKDTVRAVSNYNGDFYFRRREALKSYRVIVCTVVTAGRIASAKFPPRHFNRVFIDEAGQAMEPECLVALAGVLADDGKVVLAGDPKQLGPIIRSPIAKKNGLQISLLERLMEESPLYKKAGTNQTYNAQCVTKLLKNYRSHESIISVSNEKFYDNELQVCADEFIRNSFLRWSELPSPKIPIIFEGVQGKDDREETSPSFFNVQEVKAVKKYVEKVLEYRGKKVKPSDIGVITPYRKQVQKIRQIIKDPSIKVGSVEEFQGQERLVIIISTVRSDSAHFGTDARHNLGFLRNPKRFNVAVTRAKALLIIVGNPKILSMDEHWAALLRFCIVNQAYSMASGVNFGLADMQNEVDTLSDLMSEFDIFDQNGTNPDQANPRYLHEI